MLYRLQAKSYHKKMAPLAPNCHQSGTQSCSQRQSDGRSSVTQVSAAAVPGDVVVNRQDGQIRLVLAGGCFYAASFVDRQHVGTKCWRKQRFFFFNDGG